jgi:hypothetical protein
MEVVLLPIFLIGVASQLLYNMLKVVLRLGHGAGKLSITFFLMSLIVAYTVQS